MANRLGKMTENRQIALDSLPTTARELADKQDWDVAYSTRILSDLVTFGFAKKTPLDSNTQGRNSLWLYEKGKQEGAVPKRKVPENYGERVAREDGANFIFAALEEEIRRMQKEEKRIRFGVVTFLELWLMACKITNEPPPFQVRRHFAGAEEKDNLILIDVREKNNEKRPGDSEEESR